ncbi:GDSL-type esterase/lipase family protein [Paeniglutamicibacter sp. MACA_103]|uniref:GDSL-type esterase/lipase family protein n=1 Tax=Paeniglutamicibacter sp. MACA_103 TaxID=3377337 RepID=UPI003893D031
MARIKAPRLLAIFSTGIAAFAMTLTGMGPATALATPTEASSSGVVNYVNLGDSYSAGFGSGSLAAGPLPGCLQGSGPTHVSKIAAMENVDLAINAACAGLTTTEIAGVTSVLAPQLAAADLTTLTLGANDLDIRGLVLACSTMGSDATCEQALAIGASLIPAIGASARQTLQLLDSATAGKVLVLGYPRLFTTSNGDQPLITAARARDLNDLGDLLNEAIRTAAEETSAKFVPVLGPFNNHGLGAGDPWIYFNLANLADPFNLHPTTTGYLEGYYPAVRNHIHLNQLVR